MEVPCSSSSSSRDVVVKEENIEAMMIKEEHSDKVTVAKTDNKPKDLVIDIVKFESAAGDERFVQKNNYFAAEKQTENIIKEQEDGIARVGDHADTGTKVMRKDEDGAAAFDRERAGNSSETQRDGITVVVVVDVHAEKPAIARNNVSSFEKKRADDSNASNRSKKDIRNYIDSRMIGLDDITVVEDVIPRPVEKPIDNNNAGNFLSDLCEDDILMIEELYNKHVTQSDRQEIEIWSMEKGVTRVKPQENDDVTVVYNSKENDIVVLGEYLDSNSNNKQQSTTVPASFQNQDYFNYSDAFNEANLRDAVDIGDLNGVKSLLYAKKLDYNANVHGILASALKNGYADIAVELLQHGATPVFYYETTGNDKLLHLTASLQNETPLRLLLSKYPVEWMLTLNERNETCLHIAAKNKNAKLLDALLTHLLAYNQWKCQNLVDNDGLSLFHIVCTSKYPNYVVRFLDETQVPIEETVPSTSRFCPGYNALHFAASYYRYETVKILTERGADLKATTATGLSALHVICKMDDLKWILYEASPDSISNLTLDELVKTMCNNLRSRLSCHHCDIMELLFAKGCCVDARDGDGNNALMHLVTNKYKLCVQEFLEEKRWLNSNLSAAIGYTLREHQLKTINRILNQYIYDANLQKSRSEAFALKNNAGLTCLHRVASEKIVSNMTEYLLREGAEAQVFANDHSSPLHLAAKNHSFEFIDCVYNFSKIRSLDKMVDVNAQDDRGNTPLHYAYVKGATDFEDYRCFLLLLKLGTDVTIENESGSSVLSIVTDDLSKMTSNVFFPTMVAAFNDTVNNAKWEPDRGTYGNFALFAKRIEENKSDLIFASQFWKLSTMLRTCEYCSDPAFELFVDELSSRIHVTDESIESKVIFVSSCEFEVSEMKRIRVDGVTTLHNILNHNMNKVAGYTKYDSLKAILESQNLEKSFPLYATMLKARYVRGLARASLLEKAMVSLRNMMDVDIPVSCLYKITSFLTEKKLRDLIQISERFICEIVASSEESCEPCQKVARKS